MTTIRILGEIPPAAHDAQLHTGCWRVPEETPVAFVYNRRNYAVMLATPMDLEDFAIGFSITERVVDTPDDISSIDIHCSHHGIEFHLAINSNALERLDVLQRRRNLVGRAGCGICGLENAETFFKPLPIVAEVPRTINDRALGHALKSLVEFQKLNAETRTVHAAAWADWAGKILLVREDVGRHNALDKLLGALVRKNIDAKDGFVLMTSRCSYEIVEKAAQCGVQVVASISAPTAFAIRKAAEANMALYARDHDKFVCITAIRSEKL